MEKFLKRMSKYKTYLYSILAVVILAVILTTVVAVNTNKTPNSIPTNTDSIKFSLPVLNASITKGYNADELQYNKGLNCWEIHKGLDLLAEIGDNVLACYDGEVTNITSNYLDGTTIEITHSDGLKSVYSGLNSDTKVRVGDSVKINDVIGVVGSELALEGEEGSHVHFELIKDGEKVDPLNYIEIGLKD